MAPFKITTKWITIEVYRRGIVFTVASLLLPSGVALCNQTLLLALLTASNEVLFNVQCGNHSLYVGLFLILVSLFLFYLLIINWRKEIYSKVFYRVQKSVDALGTSWRARIRYASPVMLMPLFSESQEKYEEAASFVRENQTLIDVETYQEAWSLLNKVGEENIQLRHYIGKLEKIETGEISMGDYNPELANKATEEYMDDIKNQYKSFVSLIKRKEKYRIK